jgi:ABC-type proline/glycine betaine transport system ATPase subunit
VADRIALMRAGRIIQTGTISQLRKSPSDAWVAEFVAVD